MYRCSVRLHWLREVEGSLAEVVGRRQAFGREGVVFSSVGDIDLF